MKHFRRNSSYFVQCLINIYDLTKQQAVQVFLCKSGTHGTQTLVHTNTRPLKNTPMTHKPTRTQIPRFFLLFFLVMCLNTEVPEEVGTSHFSFTLISSCVHFFALIVSIQLSFPMFATLIQVSSS